MFNYNHLYYFYVTAKAGGVTPAAKTLRIAQPSLSAQLKTLEGTLNKKLFQRVGRQIKLSAEGRIAYGFCRRIFEVAEEFGDYINQSDKSKGLRIRIGVTDQIERPFVAKMVSAIVRNKVGPLRPMVSMISEKHSELLEQLRTREIDLLLSNQPAYAEEVKALASADMPVVLIVAKRAFKGGKVQFKGSLTQILNTLPGGLVLPSEKLLIRQETDAFIQNESISAPMVFESDILSAAIRAIIDGVGYGFLPLPYVIDELKQGLLFEPIPNKVFWEHKLHLTSLSKKPLDSISIEIQNFVLNLSGVSRPLRKRNPYV